MNSYKAYRQHLLDFPKQLSPKMVRLANAEKLRHARPDGVVVSGMGGSGLPGTFLEALAGYHRLKVPVLAWKDHGVPKTPFRRPLYIFVSFSGNTEETLSGLRALLRKRKHKPTAVVTGGGAMRCLAERHRLPLVLVETRELTPLEVSRSKQLPPSRRRRESGPLAGLTPREGVGYLYYNLLSLLRAAFPSLAVRDLSHTIHAGRWEPLGKALAKHFVRKVALIYTGGSSAHLGAAWKILLNETAKQPAFAGTYPEMGHNEIAALQRTSHAMAALFLEGRFGSSHERKHFKAIEKLLTQRGVTVLSIPLAGRTGEEQTWNGFLLGHWTALALARRKNVNPRSIPLIERLKKEVSA